MENNLMMGTEIGKEGGKSKQRFSLWADEWYEEYRLQVQPSTYSNYKYTLRILRTILIQVL